MRPRFMRPALLALAYVTPAGAAPADTNRMDRMIEAQATGTFDVTLTPVTAADAPVGGLTIAKTFHGDLAAGSAGQMLAVRTPVDGSAGYVAMERVTGTLAGRTGSFALQHSGTMAKGAQSLSITVVPDSGTDALAGIAGSMDIRIEGGRHFYTFRYTLPRQE
jgi:hypothetical protein